MSSHTSDEKTFPIPRSTYLGNNSQNSNVGFSNLEPTAQEFYPASAGFHNGAVKKRPQQQFYNRNRIRENGRGRNRFGTGRTFNGFRNDYSAGHMKGRISYNNSSENSEDINKEGHYLQSTEEKMFVNNLDQYSTKHVTSADNKNLGESSFSQNRYVDSQNKSTSGSSRSFRGYGGNSEKSKRNFNSNKNFERNFYENTHQNYHRNLQSSEKFQQNSEKFCQPHEKSFQSYDQPPEKFSQNYDRYLQRNVEKPKFNYRDKGRRYGNGNFCRYDGNNVFSDNKRNQNMPDHQTDYKWGDSELRDHVKLNPFKMGFKPHFENRANNKTDEGGSSNDWRKSRTNDEKTSNEKSNKKLDAASQRVRLVEMLSRRILECLVCCEKIKNSDKVWSCILCYHILHLHCVSAWAKSSKIENSWRCPACQNVCCELPEQYKCYCGKMLEPRYEAGTIPHGCGEMCLRKGRTCEHKCTILCHPGPCPDCTIMVAKPCGCGATKPIVKCSNDVEIVCDSLCNKTLECGAHSCKSKCHSGLCSPCEETIIQECFCGKEGRKVACCAEYKGQTHYNCGEVCDKLLSCGNHNCQKICHDGPCDVCVRDVDAVQTCPCGKTRLLKPRTSCSDPIPCCDKICGKPLKCGQPNNPHRCEQYCHEGDCPPCPLTTVVRCRCGNMDKELSCLKLTTKADDARCEKKCIKKRSCAKHKCNQRCCIEIEHICPLPCNHQLSCGQHRCERTCHSGRCPPCMETSFEELYCECGKSVLFPPIPCGTKPPSCSEPCSRQRPCGHEPNHSCHTGPCPQCTVLSKRWCYGKHEQRAAIPCHQQNFSCGLPCGKEMPCGRHKCNKPCHDGPCPSPCRQPCTVLRSLCGHPCGRPCHDPPCPESSCKQNVPITCLCGVQKSTRPCIEVADEFKNLQMAQIKEKMGVLSVSHAVDISDILYVPMKPSVLKILECTEECKVLERNRRLAIGLQIRNPDLSQKLTPKYSDFMRLWAKKDPHFCQRVHDKLTELVQLAKNSKQKSRSYSFESMNRDKRHFVHDYCEHFGVESAAYDAEPNRNIVATAIKDKSWLPSMGLLEVIQRENGQRKVPGPMSVSSKGTPSKPETVSLKLPIRVQRAGTPPSEVDSYNPPL
ncbi:nuclear transcription factor, X-box binding stc [Leptinotarsa decemlineata]|uniref:nuclear transcription factor, X-box binding stc n=1 Tax=Leptinotarsa decemlineata TaxID=7539 RepID=UPI003D305AC6